MFVDGPVSQSGSAGYFIYLYDKLFQKRNLVLYFTKGTQKGSKIKKADSELKF